MLERNGNELHTFGQNRSIYYDTGLAPHTTYEYTIVTLRYAEGIWTETFRSPRTVTTRYVGGLLTRDTTWSGGIWKINNLTLGFGATLTIENGADVEPYRPYDDQSMVPVMIRLTDTSWPYWPSSEARGGRIVASGSTLRHLHISGPLTEAMLKGPDLYGDGEEEDEGEQWPEELSITDCVLEYCQLKALTFHDFHSNSNPVDDDRIQVAGGFGDVRIHGNQGAFDFHLIVDDNVTLAVEQNDVKTLRLTGRPYHVEGGIPPTFYPPVYDATLTVRSNAFSRGHYGGELAAWIGSLHRSSILAFEHNDCLGGVFVEGDVSPFPLTGDPRMRIRNNKITNLQDSHPNAPEGIRISYFSEVLVEGNTVHGPFDRGIRIDGYFSYASQSNQIFANSISNCTSGLVLSHIVDNDIAHNRVDFYDFGLGLHGMSQHNTIWNNAFRRHSSGYPLRDAFLTVESGYGNTFNIAKTPGLNIVGGPYLGGNYWSLYGGPDEDGDKLGDSPHELAPNNVDDLPLYVEPPPVLTLQPGSDNPDETARVYGLASPHDYTTGRRDVPILAVTLAADTTDDWKVHALSFESFGSGNEQTDVAEARLYRGGIEGTLLGALTFDADNGMLVFPLNETITAGSSAHFTLVYDFVANRAYPCNAYGALTHTNLIHALPVTYAPGLMEQPDPVVGGPTRIRRGELTMIEGNSQFGEADDPAENAPLPLPLKLRLAWQHPQTVQLVTYTLTQSPGAEGFLGGVPGQSQTHPPLDAEGYVQETLTLGFAKGIRNPYTTAVDLTHKGEACVYSWSIPVFNAWGKGLDPVIEAQHDNPANGEWFGTYLGQIEALNAFTLTLNMAPTDFGTVNQVRFILGDHEVAGEMLTPNDVYRAIFDMQAHEQVEMLTVVVQMTVDGQQIEEHFPANVKNIRLPAWVDLVGAICHPDSFSANFDADASTYRLAFRYPTDFSWSDWVPDSVGLLGGLHNELNIAFEAHADYGVDEQSAFLAVLSGQPVLLGTPIGMQGRLSGEFDPNFAFRRGSGQISANVSFDLPERGLSKTFFVLGLPLTVAVDLSGEVDIRLAGGAVLDNQLAFEQITLSPATTVTGHLTVSLSALLGVAKLAAQGSPSATVEMLLTYRSGAGTETTWGGEVVVPVRIYGSIFWGFAEGEIASTEFGPWVFGDSAASSSKAVALASKSTRLGLLDESPSVRAPRLLAATSLAIDDTGRTLALWIGDTDPSGPAPDPDVFYRFRQGEEWGAAAPLTPANTEWESDPCGVFLADGHALAVWTANHGEKTLSDLNAILAHQDIAWSHWDGTAWCSPGRITDDFIADGSASLAYDATLDRALAVWVRNTAPDSNAVARTYWELWHAVFDPATIAFSDATPVPGTDTGNADMMPALATDGSGRVLLVWARDEDGVFESERTSIINGTNVDRTNPNSDIYASLWNGTVWGVTERVSPPDTATDYTPSAAFLPNGDAIAVWLARDNAGYRLMFSVRALANGEWSVPDAIYESQRFIESPIVLVGDNGSVQTLWRGYAPGTAGSGDVWLSETVAGSLEWASPRRISHDKDVQWSLAAALRQDGHIEAIWTGYHPDQEGAASSAGFSDGVTVAQTAPPPLAWWSDLVFWPLDLNANGLVDTIALLLPCLVEKSGEYEVRGDLYAGTEFLLELRIVQTLNAGYNWLSFSVPGSWIAGRQADGPYTLSNIRVASSGGGFVTTYDDEFVTPAFSHTLCAPSQLRFDQAVYQGPDALMVIMLDDPHANQSPEHVDHVVVRIRSSIDPAGFDLILTETGLDTGSFHGVVAVDMESSSSSPPRLHVIDAASVEVEYADLSLDTIWVAGAIWRHPFTSQGVPFEWFHRHGLTDDVYENESMRDRDGDTFLAWQEYIADTDPTDASSYLRITGLQSGPVFDFRFYPASLDRVYTLQFCGDLVEGEWSNVTNAVRQPGRSGIDTLRDTDPKDLGFYRITVELP